MNKSTIESNNKKNYIFSFLNQSYATKLTENTWLFI